MSESQMWEALRPLLKPLHPVRVENPMLPGTPDVNIVPGWIELKYAARWPSKGGPLRLDHFTKQQKTWLIRRRRAGGKAWVLLKVGAMEWLLFDGMHAALYLGKESREKLYEIAIARWTRKPTSEKLLKCLSPSPTPN